LADAPRSAPPPSPSTPPDPATGQTVARGGFAGIVAVMRQPGFRDYTSGSMFSVVGVWLQRVATGWLTWELTETPSWLGIITFTDLFVMILLAPIGGVIADRMDRLKLLHVAQILVFIQAASTAAIYSAGWMTIEVLLALTVLSGVGHAAHGAARLSLLPNLVPKELLAQAIAVNALSFNVARFLGPAIAGVVIAGWGLAMAFAINAAAHVAFSLLLLRVRVATPDAPRKSKGGVFSDMAEGYHYATSHKGIGPMLLMMLVTAFTIRALPDLLPAFAAKAFGGDVHELAWLTSAMGLGAMFGGLRMAHQHGTHGLTRFVIWNVALLAVAVGALAASDAFWFGVLAAVACGYVLTVNGTGTQTLIQSAVDGALRGRVMAVFTLIYQGAPAIGAVSLGALADHFGVRWPFLGGALLCLLMWAWMMRRAGPISAALESGAPIAHGGRH
jgi:MFS family permease